VAKLITVFVRDASNKPIAGAKVTLDGRTVVTGKQGIGRFPNVAGIRLIITAKKSDFKPLKAIVAVGQDDNIGIVMEPA
jgi:hypothetical protein